MNPYELHLCVKSGSVPTLEGKARQLDGSYKNRTDARRKCYEAVNERGWPMFTITDGGACNSGPDAIFTYGENGQASCQGFKGGPEVATVYIIPGKQFVSCT